MTFFAMIDRSDVSRVFRQARSPLHVSQRTLLEIKVLGKNPKGFSHTTSYKKRFLKKPKGFFIAV
jgi:hypothetical protein